MIVQKITRDVIREVAKEMDLPYELVREVVWSEFEYLKSVIESGVKGEPDSLNSVFLRYLGTFYPSKAKIRYMEINKLKKEENEGK